MPPAKNKPVPTDDQSVPETAPVVENAPIVENTPAVETTPVVEPLPVESAPTEAGREWTPEERAKALAAEAGLQGVSPDQVDVAAARVLNRG